VQARVHAPPRAASRGTTLRGAWIVRSQLLLLLLLLLLRRPTTARTHVPCAAAGRTSSCSRQAGSQRCRGALQAQRGCLAQRALRQLLLLRLLLQG
jgi:hypothetical protein